MHRMIGTAGRYFKFSKLERAGLLLLCVIVLFYLSMPYLYRVLFPPQEYDITAFQKELSKLKVKEEEYRDSFSNSMKNYASGNGPSKGELFQFDPNKTGRQGLEKLGLREKLINTISNYLAKGGKFREPGDIRKIWGIRPEEAERLLPYIKIEKQEKEFLTDKRDFREKRFARSFDKQTPVDINIADTTEWIALPGIGSKLANRIVQFRERLGGFYSVDQVAEVYGLKDSTFQKIRPRLVMTGTGIKKININSATIDEMKIHPYIRYSLANIIFQYRVQHGNYEEPIALKKIMVITDELYNKLAPYIAVR